MLLRRNKIISRNSLAKFEKRKESVKKIDERRKLSSHARYILGNRKISEIKSLSPPSSRTAQRLSLLGDAIFRYLSAVFFSQTRDSRVYTPWKNTENLEFSGNFFIPGEIRNFS